MVSCDKMPLLCTECEQRFASAEREVANTIVLPFHENDRDEFSYGPSLHYFMTSLAWRTLILDLPGLECEAENPRATLATLGVAAETMRKYLLGATNLAESLRNHAIIWTKAQSGSAHLARPNTMIRRSVFGYTVLHRQLGYCGILHNLAGFMCFLIVKGNPRDTWEGTKVDAAGGRMKQPQACQKLAGRRTFRAR